jgi:hypothetical protein
MYGTYHPLYIQSSQGPNWVIRADLAASKKLNKIQKNHLFSNATLPVEYENTCVTCRPCKKSAVIISVARSSRPYKPLRIGLSINSPTTIPGVLAYTKPPTTSWSKMANEKDMIMWERHPRCVTQWPFTPCGRIFRTSNECSRSCVTCFPQTLMPIKLSVCRSELRTSVSGKVNASPLTSICESLARCGRDMVVRVAQR